MHNVKLATGTTLMESSYPMERFLRGRDDRGLILGEDSIDEDVTVGEPMFYEAIVDGKLVLDRELAPEGELVVDSNLWRA